MRLRESIDGIFTEPVRALEDSGGIHQPGLQESGRQQRSAFHHQGRNSLSVQVLEGIVQSYAVTPESASHHLDAMRRQPKLGLFAGSRVGHHPDRYLPGCLHDP